MLQISLVKGESAEDTSTTAELNATAVLPTTTPRNEIAEKILPASEEIVPDSRTPAPEQTTTTGDLSSSVTLPVTESEPSNVTPRSTDTQPVQIKPRTYHFKTPYQDYRANYDSGTFASGDYESNAVLHPAGNYEYPMQQYNQPYVANSYLPQPYQPQRTPVLNNFYPFPYPQVYQNQLNMIFQHMFSPDYPAEIVKAAQNVLQYLQTSNQNFDDTIAIVNSFQGANPLDRLVGFLLRIQAKLPYECTIRSDVSNLIIYNMMKSYLNYVPVLNDNLSGDPFSFNSFENSNQLKTIIKHLLSKLKCCEAQLVNTQAKNRDMKPQIKYVEKPVIKIIEKPAPPPQIIKEIEYVEKPCPTTPAPTTPSPYLQVLNALPVPNNAFEKTKHDKILAFLNREDLGNILGNLDLSAAEDERAKLNMILKQAVNLDLEQPTIDAIKYYLNIAKTRTSLNLLAQREFRKEFELTKIFVATFDFENLSVEAKLAFDSFYTFLMGVTGEQMRNFIAWTDVSTKGEFMQVLFTYFLEQDFTPVEVKANIELLKPFIIMDGPGATPP